MRFARPLLFLALIAVAASTAGAQRGSDPIPKLEAARAANPRNVAALRALGVAYYKARRYQDARTVLDQSRRLDPQDGVSALYAGMSAEALRDFTNAKAAYNSYLAVGKTRRVKDQIRARLVVIGREEVLAAAKVAVANEATISRTPGALNTVAVPPMIYQGSDPSMAPLSRGMAELIITDLSRSSRLTVVERDRMQALADEIQLSQSPSVDSATSVRAGRLMQAGRLIAGSIVHVGNQLTMESRVVQVSDGTLGQPASASNNLDRLFEMEKALVFQIFERLGVTLTPAERQLVEARPTNNLNAFLAYSRGLMAADAGRFEDAARFFENARSQDPNFGAAAVRLQSAQQAAIGAQVTAATIETNLGTTVEGQQVSAASSGSTRPDDRLSNTLRNTLIDVNPSTITQVANDTRVVTTSPLPQRDAPSSGGGTDDITSRVGSVVIIIRRP